MEKLSYMRETDFFTIYWWFVTSRCSASALFQDVSNLSGCVIVFVEDALIAACFGWGEKPLQKVFGDMRLVAALLLLCFRVL